MYNRKSKSNGAVYYLSLVVILLAANSHADTIFFDDFSDGSHLDGMPVTWDSTGPDPDDEERVVDGSLVLTSGGINGGYNYAGVSDLVLTDVSIRAQVKGGPNDSIGLSAWVDFVNATSIWGRIDSAGEVRVSDSNLVPTDLRLEDEDIVLQFDVFGNQLSLWAWRPHEDMPIDPLVTNSLDDSTSGGIVVWVSNWPWSDEPVEGIYRYVHVADAHLLSPACDFNSDAVCRISDIDALVTEIALMTNNPRFDLDGDGFVDAADRDEWLAQAGALNLDSGNPYLVADFNLDGSVDGQDFIIWNGSKFSPTGKWSLGDANGDGVTDGQDFIAWNLNKFQSADGISAVPEPAATTLLTIAMLAVSVARGRS